MKLIFTSILIILILSSCFRDCGRKVIEMKMKSITENQTNKRAIIEGYYYSEFQSGTLNFEINFTHQGAGDFCNYYWVSYPVENGLKIYSKDTILLNNRKILPNELLNDYLVIQKIEKNSFLKYFVTLKQDILSPNSGTYQFNGNLELDDGVFLSDSCLIKFY
jgi:hypothetical protein